MKTSNESPVYIGGFTYELGENEHDLEDLPEIKGNTEQIARLRNGGFSKYRTSDRTVLELAGAAIDKLFTTIPIRPAEIDLVVFGTSSFSTHTHLIHHDLCTFLLAHGLEKAYPLASSLSFCGNFLPALRTAHNYTRLTEYNNILVVVSDIVPKSSSRLTPPDIAVGSDGAACCVVSGDNFSNFELNAIYQSVNARSGLLDPDKDFLKYTKAVGDGIKEAIGKTFGEDTGSREKLTRVFTNNYSKAVCESFLRLVRIPERKLNADNIPRFGHAGAADICINIFDYLATRSEGQDEELLLLSSGPFMWGSALIRSVQSS